MTIDSLARSIGTDPRILAQLVKEKLLHSHPITGEVSAYDWRQFLRGRGAAQLQRVRREVAEKASLQAQQEDEEEDLKRELHLRLEAAKEQCDYKTMSEIQEQLLQSRA